MASIKHGARNPHRTRRIIRLYRRGKTMQTIADSLGITKARIHQILMRQAPNIIRSRGRHV